MVVCGICKQSKDTRNRWLIHEHASDNSIMRDFKVCDECAGSMIRRVLAESKAEEASEKEGLNLARSGLLDSIILAEDNTLQVTLLMDLAKARKVVLESGPQDVAATTSK